MGCDEDFPDDLARLHRRAVFGDSSVVLCTDLIAEGLREGKKSLLPSDLLVTYQFTRPRL